MGGRIIMEDSAKFKSTYGRSNFVLILALLRIAESRADKEGTYGLIEGIRK
jgi:hypothetical protein